MGSEEIEGCAGVALFGKSLEADLAAFEWAYKHLHLSEKYKLRIIHVNKLNNANPPRERPDLRYEHDDLDTKFKENYPDCKIGKLQTDIRKIKECICGVTYEGENFEAALQHAINSLQKDEGLDTLVLGWSVADDTKGPPPIINNLESKGCSIVLAKVDSRKLTFSMPPMASTEMSAATAGAPSMASLHTDQPSNKTNSSTSSGLETEARPPGRDKDTTADESSAEPSSRGKTKIK